jgi:hypothetical protein
MAEERAIKNKTVQCANGHNLKLEMLSGTPELMTTIQCPSCQIVMMVLAGDIRGIVPIE